VKNRTSYSKARGYPDASSDAQTDASIDVSLMHQWCRGIVKNTNFLTILKKQNPKWWRYGRWRWSRCFLLFGHKIQFHLADFQTRHGFGVILRSVLTDFTCKYPRWQKNQDVGF
jgi:hypothetical protein